MRVIYLGRRVGRKNTPVHLYREIGPEQPKELYFKKPFTLPHRVGDVLELTSLKSNPLSFTPGKEVLEHIDSAEDEAIDRSVAGAEQERQLAKKLADRSDLREALEPIRRAYRRLTGPQQAAMLTWLIREVREWK